MDSAPIYGPDVVTDDPAFIHPTASLYGHVRIGRGVSIWPNAVCRAEAGQIAIGEMSNIQDMVMIHGGGVEIGHYCSITHHAIIHACTIGNNCLVGINATVMDRAVIGDNSIVAGGAFVTEGTIIPPNSIVMGSPGEVRRERNNYVANRMNAVLYHRNALAYAKGEYREWSKPEHRAFMEETRARLEREFETLFP
jgi:carbonic anhydrase/acetyltransferase-like protein (isoleucine patch superfamily)